MYNARVHAYNLRSGFPSPRSTLLTPRFTFFLFFPPLFLRSRAVPVNRATRNALSIFGDERCKILLCVNPSYLYAVPSFYFRGGGLRCRHPAWFVQCSANNWEGKFLEASWKMTFFVWVYYRFLRCRLYVSFTGALTSSRHARAILSILAIALPFNGQFNREYVAGM